VKFYCAISKLIEKFFAETFLGKYIYGSKGPSRRPWLYLTLRYAGYAGTISKVNILHEFASCG